MKLGVACLLASALAGATLLEQGRALYNANRFAEARAVLEKAARANPAGVQERFWLACTLMALDDMESALRRFEPLEKALGSDPEYLYAVSETYTRAARRLANILVAAGDSARAHQHMAHRYANTGDWKTAVDELRIASNLRPTLPGVRLEAAQLLWEQQQYDEAARELEAELAVAPESFLANLRYGQYLIRKSRFTEAVHPLEVAARHRRMPEAALLLAFNYVQMRQPELAMDAVAHALAVFPGNRDLVQMRDELLAANPHVRGRKRSPAPAPLEEPRHSASRLRALLAGNPKDEDALYLLSELYSERSAEYFERLAAAAPDSTRVLQIRGLNAETMGDLKEAEACYRQALQREPRLAGGHYSLGHLLRRLGRDTEAQAELQRELEIDPSHHLAYFELGAMHLVAGDAQAAVPLLEKSVKLRPAPPDPKVELAKAYIQLKRGADAIPLLRSAIESEPEHPTAHYLLSRAYLMTGAAAESRREVIAHQEILRKQSRLRRSMAQRQLEEKAAGK